MPLNVSIFPPSRIGPSGSSDAHNASAIGAGDAALNSVLLASTSMAIMGPCQLVLIPDEGERVRLVKVILDPAADPPLTGMKLLANQLRKFELSSGQWWLRQIVG